MIIDSINLNHLRIFECVYRTRSMTDAARELHLTQSGVSQHIKTFEDGLGVKLFDRINQRLVPTGSAASLYQQCASGLNGIEQALADIKGGERRLTGSVTMGMPIEFGNNVLLPLLSKFSKKHPLVKFKIRLGFASEMNTAILKGDLDFAIVDDYIMDRRITMDKVYDEVLELCIHQEFIKKNGAPKHARKYYEALDYVEYQEDEPILRMWFAHHLKTRHLSLNVKATVMDVQGVAKLIQTGMGAGVLPTHLLQNMSKAGSAFYIFKGCGEPLKNAISVAYLKERTHSTAASNVLEFLRSSLEPNATV